VKIIFFALFEEKPNKLLDQLNITRISGIRQGNLVSGWIPDIIKGRIIRPDIRCIPKKNYGKITDSTVLLVI
jgi:hypothetical protein